MQRQLDEAHPELGIVLYGVNQVGLESTGEALAARGYTIPLLQDTLSVNAWDQWQVNYRDFFILDADGVLVSVTQLSPEDEGGGGIVNDRDAYRALLDSLVAAAQ